VEVAVDFCFRLDQDTGPPPRKKMLVWPGRGFPVVEVATKVYVGVAYYRFIAAT
jgi:hypothetical protein